MPFPLFLLAVCAAVTVGATAVRALAAGGHAPQVLSGTAERLLAFLDYFAGVFTLLSLTAAVLCGLAATDRLVLTPRLRVAAQSVHRATSVAAVGFLATHIGVKIAERDASPLAALLPFGGGATFAVGLGTLAADLLVLAAATGAVRGRFADARRPGLWRVLHASAYACWPIALAHGLTAGRAAAVWVLWSYGVCGALVALALLVRGLGLLDRRPEATRLRAYRPRRPSRVALAELAALSREHQAVPYASHAPRAGAGAGPGASAVRDAYAAASPGAAPGADAGAMYGPGARHGASTVHDAYAYAAATPGAARGAGVRHHANTAHGASVHGPDAGALYGATAAGGGPERPREHPRLADTPPNGVPVHGLPHHTRPRHEPFTHATAADPARVASHDPHRTGRHSRRPAPGVSTPAGAAPSWAHPQAHATAAFPPGHGPWQGPGVSPGGQGYAGGPYGWAAAPPTPWATEGGTHPHATTPDPTYPAAAGGSGWAQPAPPVADPGVDWGSGEWGPLTWDAPTAGGVGV
ncbi:hypothetical protein [Streptacidiphilus sp. MAP12-33]|uniref:hypothetical protein n=1 Tax=Streptacidiphilus sp. MAP12-33 TaxID=3156266 RepID=UPI003518181D